jgi:hypothetical protein
LTIQEVDLIVQRIAPMPHPLNVWNETLLGDYENENQYQVFYGGQDTGATLTGKYLRFEHGVVHLKPRETDQIDVHLISQLEANIWFLVRVIYRVDNESQLHTLQLPQMFQVMFATESDWHLYRLQNGHFVPSS